MFSLLNCLRYLIRKTTANIPAVSMIKSSYTPNLGICMKIGNGIAHISNNIYGFKSIFGTEKAKKIKANAVVEQGNVPKKIILGYMCPIK